MSEDWGDSWDGDEDSGDAERDGFLQRGWRRLFGGDNEKAGKTAEDDFAEVIEAAQTRVENYYASGMAEQHRRRLPKTDYRASAEYRIACQTEQLGLLLAKHDAAFARSDGDALLDQELWAKRIAGLNQALADAEREAAESEASYETIEERWHRGAISRAEYDDLHRRLGKKEQRDGTRLEMSGLGGSFQEIGDVGDQASHILEDALSDDNGVMRQAIAKKVRAMPRWMALKILQQAVNDGVISQETADYLIRDCVRPR